MSKRNLPLIPADEVAKLRIAKFKGRLLNIAPYKHGDRRVIVLVYGHHSSLERWYLMAKWLSRYGRVYVPDLPGFGGMTSFYQTGNKRPTLDDFADYLMTFLQTYKLTKNVRLIGMSFGGAVVTRMLQRHVETRAWIGKLLCFVPTGGVQDIRMKKSDHLLLKSLSSFGSSAVGARVLKILAYNRFSSYAMVKTFMRYKKKMHSVSPQQKEQVLAMEMDLWQRNDVRTHGTTGRWLLGETLIKDDRAVDHELHVLLTSNDQYFDPSKVVVSMQRVFRRVISHEMSTPTHAPSIIGSLEEIDRSMPDSLKQVLAS